MHRKIGQLLSEIVPLSMHDVEDILQEQKSTRQRFGDAALSLGMVAPEHVWRAWISQLEADGVEIDLDEVGVDSQVVCDLPRNIARKYHALPVRGSGSELLIACEHRIDDAARKQIQKHLHRHAVFILARSGQVDRAINQYHPPTPRRTEAA